MTGETEKGRSIRVSSRLLPRNSNFAIAQAAQMPKTVFAGTTIAAVVERVLLAGGRPTTAILHYKPARSKVALTPDHFVVATDAWVVYPFKHGK